MKIWLLNFNIFLVIFNLVYIHKEQVNVSKSARLAEMHFWPWCRYVVQDSLLLCASDFCLNVHKSITHHNWKYCASWFPKVSPTELDLVLTRWPTPQWSTPKKHCSEDEKINKNT